MNMSNENLLFGTSAVERIKMVKAMEFIARQINDEEVFEEWLMDGVADGDIRYADLSVDAVDFSGLDYYIEDEHFAELMETFLSVMKGARRSGGLYCGCIVSKG